jgi:hypothetical protein
MLIVNHEYAGRHVGTLSLLRLLGKRYWEVPKGAMPGVAVIQLLRLEAARGRNNLS